jgi:hypothetical protein
MKIGGWILFVLGIVFTAGLLVVAFTGDGFPLRGLIYAVILTVTGWRLKSYGTGLVSDVRTSAGLSGIIAVDAEAAGKTALPENATGIVSDVRPSAGPSGTISFDAEAAGKPALPEIATVELPFTPGVADLLRETAKKSGRAMATVMGVFLVVFVVVGIAERQSDQPSGPHVIGTFTLMLLMFVSCGLLVGSLWFFFSGLPVWRDIKGNTYLRTRGPIQVVTMSKGILLRLSDKAFSLGEGPANAYLRSVNWAVVDYSKHVHLILGVWDSNGKNLYLAERYAPENLIVVDANNRI